MARETEKEVKDDVVKFVQTSGGVVTHEAIIDYLNKKNWSLHAPLLARWASGDVLVAEVVAKTGENAQIVYRVGGQ